MAESFRPRHGKLISNDQQIWDRVRLCSNSRRSFHKPCHLAMVFLHELASRRCDSCCRRDPVPS